MTDDQLAGLLERLTEKISRIELMLARMVPGEPPEPNEPPLGNLTIVAIKRLKAKQARLRK